MPNPSNLFNNFKNTIITKFGSNPAKMLIYTGVIGWFLSAAAQVIAVATNTKLSKKEKAFLIPQEIGDGAVNILSFLLLTTSIKSLASKLVSTGKLVTPEIKTFLQKHGIDKAKGLGKADFNIENLKSFGEIKDSYEPFKKGIDVIAMTAGSILSCNIVTPILRNKFAANRQAKYVAKMNNISEMQAPHGIRIDEYLKLVSTRHSTGLRI